MVGAEYSRASINLVTKSGTNEFHGGAWEFLRNNDFDARPFNLAQSNVPAYRRNQFGGNLGAPILKSKLFGFFTYEGLKVGQAAADLTSVQVPTAEQRLGDFSLVDPKGIKDPDNVVNGKAQLFTGGKIPTERINPLALAAINAMPLPSTPGSSLFQNTTELLTQDNNNYSGRLDYTVTTNWTLFSRYSLARENASIPSAVTNRDGLNIARAQNAVLGSTLVITPNLLNETRLGFSRQYILTGLPELSFDVNGQQQKLPQFVLNPYPNMGGAGGYAATTGGGIVRVDNTSYQLYDNVAWTMGKHQFKFGGQIYHVQYERYEAPNTLGTFTFTSGYTGDALASMMLAVPQTSARTIGPSRIDGRQWSYAGYAQDDFRLAKNLTSEPRHSL